MEGDTRQGGERGSLECKIHRLLAYKVRCIYQAGEERQGETSERGGGGSCCWSRACPLFSHRERDTIEMEADGQRGRERERAWSTAIAASREALAGKFKRSAIRHQIDHREVA